MVSLDCAYIHSRGRAGRREAMGGRRKEEGGGREGMGGRREGRKEGNNSY